MTLHEAIEALIDAAESGNSLVMERAIAEARAAQEAYQAEQDDTSDEEALPSDGPAPEAPEA